MDPKILKECNVLAFQNKITFPETVKRLAMTGVERYCADLMKLEKIYYTVEGESHVEALPLHKPPQVALQYSQNGVKEALAAIQSAQIDYPEFLRRIMASGIVYYDIFINGRKAIYTSRNGEFYVENF